MGWGCPWGDPDSWVITLGVGDFRSGCSITFVALFSQFYQLVIDGRNSGVPVFINAGETKTLKGSYSLPASPHTVSVVGVGPWATPNLFDVTSTQVAYLESRAERIAAEIIGAPEQFATGSSADAFTSWAVNGLQRFTNCAPVDNRPTWGAVDFELVLNADGSCTLTLSNGGTVLAAGTSLGALGTFVPTTLLEVNGSGVSGTVNAFNNLSRSGTLVTSWPAEYWIYYQKNTPVTVFGSPTAKMFDDGHGSTASFKSPPLDTGTWYVVIHQVNDDGIESAGTTNQQVLIVKVPAAPAEPFLNPLGGEGIRFAASSDAAATYNIYDSLGTGVLPAAPTLTHAAATGLIDVALTPLFSSGFTGVRYVLVKALLGGVESGNAAALAITYVAGVFSKLLPNPPQFQALATSGRQLTVSFSLDMLNQPVAPTTVLLYASQTPAIDYTTALATVSLGTPRTRFVLGSVAGTVPTNGLYYFAIRTNSANGRSINTDVFGPVRLSVAVPPDPSATARGGI